MNDDDDYRVGRGKPPKEHQFKKGQSGNKKGRPKGARSIYTHLERELARKVTINENGRARKVTKDELMAMALVNKAAKGDPKAIQAVQKMREEANNPFLNQDEPMVFTMKFDNEEDLSAANAEDAAKYRRLQHRGLLPPDGDDPDPTLA
jgi:hypothetical protein